jgi:general stress protein 26
MTSTDTPPTLADLLKPGTTMMVATRSKADDLRSRPITVADANGPMIRALIDVTAQWAKDLVSGETAHVTTNDNRSNVWTSLNAVLTLTRNESEIDELWNAFAGAYFEDGRDSTNIGVLHIEVFDGFYWSTPSGRIGSMISMLKAKLGDPSDSGDQGIVLLN